MNRRLTIVLLFVGVILSVVSGLAVLNVALSLKYEVDEVRMIMEMGVTTEEGSYKLEKQLSNLENHFKSQSRLYSALLWIGVIVTIYSVSHLLRLNKPTNNT